jgi:hypothetical protein
MRGNEMTPTEVITILREYSNWRKRGDDWPPSPSQTIKAINAAIEMIEQKGKMEVALRQHHNNEMGEGFDLSHPLVALRVSAYQAGGLYAKTVAALGESK